MGLWLYVHLTHHLYHITFLPANREVPEVLTWQLAMSDIIKEQDNDRSAQPFEGGEAAGREKPHQEDHKKPLRTRGSGGHISLWHDPPWLLTYIRRDQESRSPSLSQQCTLVHSATLGRVVCAGSLQRKGCAQPLLVVALFILFTPFSGQGWVISWCHTGDRRGVSDWWLYPQPQPFLD